MRIYSEQFGQFSKISLQVRRARKARHMPNCGKAAKAFEKKNCVPKLQEIFQNGRFENRCVENSGKSARQQQQ